MPTRSRRAAAANQVQDTFRLPEATEASEEEQMLARLEAYRGDLAAQFQEHHDRLERRIKKDLESATALRLAVSRLSSKQRKMPFLDFLSQELGVGDGCEGGGEADLEADENDPISERVKRSMKRKKSVSASTAKPAGAKRARAKGLEPVTEDEAASAVKSAFSTRLTRTRAAVTTPLAATTPLSVLRGGNSAARAPATRTRSRLAASTTAEAQNARGLGRPLKESEPAYSSDGSPLINPFQLRPQDLRLMKRGHVGQLRKMMMRLVDLMEKA